MTAAYKVKHAVHVTITGAALQRTNHIALVSKGTECEMQVKSNYSGFEHDDSGDFRKRVEESFAKLKGSKPACRAREAGGPRQVISAGESGRLSTYRQYRSVGHDFREFPRSRKRVSSGADPARKSASVLILK